MLGLVSTSVPEPSLKKMPATGFGHSGAVCWLLPEAGLVIGEAPELDARRFHRTEGGVVLVTQQMLDALQE